MKAEIGMLRLRLDLFLLNKKKMQTNKTVITVN